MIEYGINLLTVLWQRNRIQDLFYPIIMILRQEKEGRFTYERQDADVVIQTPGGDELLRIPSSVFLVEAEKLLQAINEHIGAFAIPQIESFMNSFFESEIGRQNRH